MTPAAAEAPVRSKHHQGSHGKLLVRAETVEFEPAAVDAIIVPTARPAVYLRDAIELAGRLGCILVVLCSQRSRVWEVKKLARQAASNHIVVGLDGLPRALLPRFQTSEMLRGSKFNRGSDTSFKRNLGLLVAVAFGWKRVVFLDDDISVPDPADLRDAAGLLASHTTVGLANGGFPDNSVVCHAFRESGGLQDSFIGGGALAVAAGPSANFFPNIYNEDWFFLLDDDRLRPSAVTGLAVQSAYDPYADVRRARGEEFGDCLAEGIFGLLDRGGRIQDATVPYWRDFLTDRRLFIGEVIERVHEMDIGSAQKAPMIAALKAARGRSWHIDPELCARYLRAWQADRDVWRGYLGGPGPEKAVAELGLMHRVRRTSPRRDLR